MKYLIVLLMLACVALAGPNKPSDGRHVLQHDSGSTTVVRTEGPYCVIDAGEVDVADAEDILLINKAEPVSDLYIGRDANGVIYAIFFEANDRFFMIILFPFVDPFTGQQIGFTFAGVVR